MTFESRTSRQMNKLESNAGMRADLAIDFAAQWEFFLDEHPSKEGRWTRDHLDEYLCKVLFCMIKQYSALSRECDIEDIENCRGGDI